MDQLELVLTAGPIGGDIQESFRRLVAAELGIAHRFLDLNLEETDRGQYIRISYVGPAAIDFDPIKARDYLGKLYDTVTVFIRQTTLQEYGLPDSDLKHD